MPSRCRGVQIISGVIPTLSRTHRHGSWLFWAMLNHAPLGIWSYPFLFSAEGSIAYGIYSKSWRMDKIHCLQLLQYIPHTLSHCGFKPLERWASNSHKSCWISCCYMPTSVNGQRIHPFFFLREEQKWGKYREEGEEKYLTTADV